MTGLSVLLVLLVTPVQAQQGRPAGPGKEAAGQGDNTLQDFVRFEAWLKSYKDGAVRLIQAGVENEEAIQTMTSLLDGLAKWDNLAAARKLMAAASIDPEPPDSRSATARLDFHRELQPWRVRKEACARLAAMTDPEVERWMLGLLRDTRNSNAAERTAVMRVLGAKGSVGGTMELLRAAGSLPPEERVRAVHGLSQIAGADSVTQFLALTRDVEPNVRIAAINGIGKGLSPLTDETVDREPDAAIDRLRDQAVARLRELLTGDRIWQVRAAAAEALFALRCRAAIPALIAGLEAEHGRKKDPWAMDMKLQRLLERMTGQNIAVGQPSAWKDWYAREGSSFRFAIGGQEPQRRDDDRYARFFSLTLESDRVMFVLDFSGSMAEPVTLRAATTAASAGTTTTKAKLVVEELKRIISALPDGTGFNLIVFSDEVRVWREGRDGRPAIVKIDDDARDDLLGSYLDSLAPKGPTNLHGALDRALQFAGRGLYDRYYETAFDTLYVLSDGAPSYGTVVDTDEILRLVKDANGLRKLTIHTVTFGDKNETSFLGKLAEQNGGRHIHVD